MVLRHREKIKRFAATVLSLGFVLAGSMTAFAAEAGYLPEEIVLTEGTAWSFLMHKFMLSHISPADEAVVNIHPYND